SRTYYCCAEIGIGIRGARLRPNPFRNADSPGGSPSRADSRPFLRVATLSTAPQRLGGRTSAATVPAGGPDQPTPATPAQAPATGRRSMTTCIQDCPNPKSPRSCAGLQFRPLLSECHRIAILGGGVARKRPPSIA